MEATSLDGLRSVDRDRYLSVLYAPAESRADLTALYAFNAEIAAIRDRIREPMPGEIRLQWWRDAIETGDAGGHPLASALLETIRRRSLQLAPFLHYLDARIFDLYDDPMPSRGDLEGYCGETAAALIQLAALVLAPAAAAGSADASGHAGCAQAIAGLLRLLPLHRSRGQCYVPRDILSAAGTSPEEFVRGADPASMTRAVAGMAALGREHYAAFLARAPALPPALLPAYLPLAPVAVILDRAAARPSDVLEQRLDIGEWRRHWLFLGAAAGRWRRLRR